MPISAADALLLYRTIIQDELLAILKSRNTRISLNSNQRDIIKGNNKRVAELAANYYISEFGAELSDDEAVVQANIDESIEEALRQFQ